MITRSFFCLNRYCGHSFDAVDNEAPACPRCAGEKTRWVPKTTGILSGKTRQTDLDVKGLREQFGDRNFNSPARGGHAAPAAAPAAVKGRTRKWSPMQGWAVDLPETAQGQLYDAAFCGPTGVTAKQSAAIGSVIPVDKRSATATGAVPLYQASHRPPGGLPK